MPKTINDKVLVQMYRAGKTYKAIGQYLKCSRSGIREAVARLGLPRRPRGWKPAGYSATISAAMLSKYRHPANAKSAATL